MRPWNILANNPIMMVLAFITAMVVGGFPGDIFLTNSNIAMLSLIVMMSLSLTSLRLRGLKLRDHALPIRNAFLLSFVLSTGTTIAMSYLFKGDVRDGWIIMAAVPSAVSIVPFTYLLGGDLDSTLVSSASLYIFALAATPLVTLVFLGTAVDVMTLLGYVGYLILLPMIASRLLRRVDIRPHQKAMAINVAFFVLVVAVAGPNRNVFFGDPVILAGLVMVAFVRLFGVGLVTNWYLVRKKAPRTRRVPEVLFASYKNTGMAATLAIALIGPTAAVPATVCTLVDIVWLIFLSKSLFNPSKSDPVPSVAALTP
jgi:bile acid:Na+ symporter, BASS family